MEHKEEMEDLWNTFHKDCPAFTEGNVDTYDSCEHMDDYCCFHKCPEMAKRFWEIVMRRI